MLDVFKAIALWTFIVAFLALSWGFIDGYTDNTCTVTIKDSQGNYHELTGKTN